ncbi:hypothetical protein M9H77_03022 [Catharanthus roseus]|uniref:Uncharacterized protein n=1 Tax=Catharanthus roseus TaxID=4058 RepID=A0ACC0CAI2_CATRO|nr:hypothetical protein M9H77_03022 [Catharanthus roseus]
MPKLGATNGANWKRKNSRRGKNRSYRRQGQSHIEGHVNSHTQRGYGNYNHHGSFGTPVQSTHQFYDGNRHTTPTEEVPRHEAWHEDNLFDDFEENPNVGQE